MLAAVPYYRRNLIIVSITTFLASASWTQVVPFLPVFLGELGVGDQITYWSGLVFSAQYAAGILMAPLWGKLADKHGRKLMAVRAGLFLCAIYFLTGMSTAPWHVLLLRFLNGALTGFIPSSIALIATNTPKQWASKYVATVQTAGATGTIVGPVIGGLFTGLFGIRGGLFASGTAVFVSVLLVVFFVEERHKVQAGVPTTFRQDIRMALEQNAMLKVMLIATLSMIASVTIQPILTLHVNDMTAGSPQAVLITGLLFSLPGLAFALTARWWVQQGDRFGHIRVLCFGLLGAGVLGAFLWLANTIYVFGLLFFVQGLFIAALRPVSSAIISDEIDEDFQGRAFGMQQSALTLGGLIGPLISGSVGTWFGHAFIFFFVGLVLILGALWLIVSERRSTEKPSVNVAVSSVDESRL